MTENQGRTTAGSMDDSQAHLRDYWRVVWQGKWTVLAITMVVATMIAVVTFMQTPIYKATARVEIQPRAKSITPNADFSQLGTTSWTWMAEERYINTQMEVIRSRDTANAVIRELGLDVSPEFTGLLDPAGALSSRIDLGMLLDTYVLEISIEDPEAEMAQRLANMVAQVYIQKNIESAASNTGKIVNELYAQIEPIKKSLADKEARRIQMARDKSLYVPEEGVTSVDSRMRQLQVELTDIQIKRGSREAVFNAIESIERGGESYAQLPDVAHDALIVDLNKQVDDLEKERETLSLEYLERHPKIIAVGAEIHKVHQRIEVATGDIIARIKIAYSIEKQRERSLMAQIQRLQAEGLDLTEAAGLVAVLDSEIKEDRRIYDLILSRIKEIDLNQETMVNNVRLLDEAVLPANPIRPRKVMNLAVGFMLGLFLGLGTVFFLDYLDNTIRSSDDIEKYLDLPLLAVIPRIRKGKDAVGREAYQTLRTSILFSSKGRSLRSILVTSAGPGEGKSSIALSLALALAGAGDRVVLLDGDLRRPTIHMRTNLDRAGGLTNYLMDKDGGPSWVRYLKDCPGSDNLKIMTCGPIPPNPVELFGSDRFQHLLDDLREKNDWVLIDSPPLASLSDSLVLASLADMVVLVIKHNTNDRDLIKRSTEQVRKVNPNLVGAVLNDIDLKRASAKDSYYTGYYYYAQADEKHKAEDREAELARQQDRG